MATVRRGAGARRVLEVCRTLQAGSAEQNESIASWLASDRGDLGSVGAVLDAADYELLLVEAPDVLAAELRAAVRWRLKDAIDFPVDEAVVDVFAIPEQVRRTGSKMMYAIAARRQAVERQVAMLRPVGRGFDVIDIPELALRNLASLLPEAQDGLILLWHRAGSAQLLVIKQSTLYLARKVHSSPAQAADGAPPEVEAIALELQRSMDYFESHYEQAPIRHLVIAPGGAHGERLAAALATETAMSTAVIDVGNVLELTAGIDTTEPLSLLALGAALREDKKAL
jgi:MSHA biogenesis protein MshI